MLETNPLTLAEAMARWHDFHTLLGTASATLIGLLFVAASVGSGVFSSDKRAPLRVFLSATVVHFSSVLAAGLIVLAPLRDWVTFGVLIAAGGGFGVVYCGLVFRDMVREGLNKSVDLEDRTWYVIVPVTGYLVEAGAGVTLASRLDIGPTVLAVAMAILMVAGIHNAWDITIWIITRRRE